MIIIMDMKPFEVPEEVVWDLETGLALNIDASKQGYPFWWIREPKRYEAFLTNRKTAGIEMTDDLPPYVEPAPMTMSANSKYPSKRPR